MVDGTIDHILKMYSYFLAISWNLYRSLTHTRLLTERNSDTKVTFSISTFNELCAFLPDCYLTVCCFWFLLLMTWLKTAYRETKN